MHGGSFAAASSEATNPSIARQLSQWHRKPQLQRDSVEANWLRSR
jgi:hypothetical protein